MAKLVLAAAVPHPPRLVREIADAPGQLRAGEALDVMENEPWVENSPLRGLDNLIVTPHCAWYTERSQRELRRKACAEVIRVLRGVTPKNVVNRDVLRYMGSRAS